MKLKLTFLIISLFLTVSLKSQITIKGMVCDSITNDTLPYATIKVYNVVNDSLVYSTISDLNGLFQIERIDNGSYIIQCSYVSFEKWSKMISLVNKELKIKIKMKPDAKVMKTFVITGDKKYSEQFNKTIFKPDSASIKNSTNALDILKNINSIEVNQLSGVASIQGEANTLVLIDNVPMSRQKPISSIKPEDIERVEIINNPTSKYDSEYSGVINIILKKEKKSGFLISTSSGAFYNFGSGNLNLEYSGKKNRFFLSSQNQYIMQKFNIHNFWQSNKDAFFDSKEVNSRYEKFDHIITAGTDIFINSNNKINLTYKAEFNNYVNMNERNIVSEINHLLNNQNVKSKYDGNVLMHNITAYYKKQFNKSGNSLSADFNYYLMNAVDNSFYLHKIILPNELYKNYTRKEDENDKKKAVNIKLDYSANLSDIFGCDAGYNLNSSNIDNVLSIEKDKNNFLYKEQRHSIYYDFFADINKWSLWAGLRYENSKVIINDSIENKIDELMPNAGISLTLNNSNKLNLSYDNFLTRPTLWELNPFIYYSDSANISGGNPFLLPSVSNNIEIKYSYFKKNNQITASVYYGWSNNLIDNITTILQTGQSYESFLNVSKNKNIGTKINLSLPLTKKIKLSTFFNGFYEDYIHENINNNGFGYTVNFNFTYDVSKKLFAGFYMLTPFSRKITPQGYTTSKFRLNQLYIGRKIFKDKGKLYFLIFDIPGDNNSQIVDGEDYNSYQIMKVKSMRAGIYFTYSFFKGKNIQKIDRDYNMEKDSKNKF